MTQYITSPDGTRIAYDVSGSGPALILLHGAGKTRHDWHTTGYVDRLQQQFTTITVDVRGSGESDMLTDAPNYAIEKICADIIAVADACDAQRSLLWGFSFGGNIARYLAAWSDRVRAAAVIGVPFDAAVHADFDQIIDGFIAEYGQMGRDFADNRLDPQQREFAMKHGIPVWLACFQAMRAWPAIAPGAVCCPTLLLVGTENTSTHQWVEANRAALDNSPVRVEIVEGIDHLQEFIEIDRVYPVVSNFLMSALD